jgi:AraC-like DNA-binding protein
MSSSFVQLLPFVRETMRAMGPVSSEDFLTLIQSTHPAMVDLHSRDARLELEWSCCGFLDPDCTVIAGIHTPLEGAADWSQNITFEFRYAPGVGVWHQDGLKIVTQVDQVTMMTQAPKRVVTDSVQAIEVAVHASKLIDVAQALIEGSGRALPALLPTVMPTKSNPVAQRIHRLFPYSLIAFLQGAVPRVRVKEMVTRSMAELWLSSVGIYVDEMSKTWMSRGRLAKACTFILQHLHEELTLADIERAVGVTPRTLHNAFAKEFGMSPYAWVLDQRLRWSHALLTQGQVLSVTEAAQTVGFGHMGRFSQAFSKRFGFSPSQAPKA